MARPDVGPLYIVQMLALAVKFGYRELIIPGFVIAENIKLGYGGLPGVVVANVLLGYRELQYIVPFSVTFKYREAAFLFGSEALP